MIYPDSLSPGDKVAIISPATKVKREYVDGAVRFLERRGYEAVVMPGANGPADGSFASARTQRLADLRDALHDPEVKAILCARGGYGCVHLISGITPEEVAAHPKWIIGFSDISALHALWHKAGVASIHAPMAKHLSLEGDDDPCTLSLFGLLEDVPVMDYHVASSPLDRDGEGQGILRGGNLAVLSGLAGTPWDILEVKEGEDVILFIEDISEAVYAVERMLSRLALTGSLGRVKGLIVGQFTEYGPDLNHPDMETMVSRLLDRYGLSGFPVAYDFPVGHVKENFPLVEGARVRLEVKENETRLRSV